MILSIYGKVNYILQMQYSGQNDEPGPDNRRYDSSIAIKPSYSEPMQTSAQGSTDRGVAGEGLVSAVIEEVINTAEGRVEETYGSKSERISN